MNAIRLPAETEKRLQTLARQSGRSEEDVVRAALDAYMEVCARSADEARATAHARLMARLEKGWDLGVDRFDRDSLYDR